jgi:hypothetical protein
MTPSRQHLIQYYQPYIADLLKAMDGVSLPPVDKLPEPFFPVFGRRFAESALRLIVIGQDTKGWGDLRHFLADPTTLAGGRIASHFDQFENHDFTDWGGNRHTFWGFAMMFYSALHGRRKASGRLAISQSRFVAPISNTPTIRSNLNAITMSIANVHTEGSWIKVYDAKNRRISQMSSSGIAVVGITGEFFVTEEGSWIKTYDEDCRRIAQMSASNVEVIGAAGSTFTTREGAWVKTYDHNCKRISQRPA